VDVAIALVLVASGAFFFLESCYLTQYLASRDDASRLTYRTAGVGAVLFVLAYLLRTLAIRNHFLAAIDQGLREWVTPLLKDQHDADPQAAAILTSFIAFALGMSSPHLVNRLLDRDARLWKAVQDDDLDALLHQAALEAKPVCVTMSNAKVYVGFVVSTIDPRIERKMFTMLPLISGYRTGTGKVDFTTNYYDTIYQSVQDSPFYDESVANPDLAAVTSDDFRLVLPVDKMLAISLFDLRVYAIFNK